MSTLSRIAGITLCILCWSLPCGDTRAQDVAAEEDTSRAGRWALDLAGKLSGAQAGYRNWAEGGVNALSATAGITGAAKRRTNAWEESHDLRLGFGLVKQDTLHVRKSEDVISMQSALRYVGTGLFRVLNPTVAASVRTQFAEGFSYDKNPFKDDRPLPVKVSDFFAPATFTQSIGLTYEPTDWFTHRVGVAGKETVVTLERLGPLYGLQPGETVRVELGLESRTRVNREVFENVVLKSTLGLFAAFNQEELPDALWENLVVMQVNRWMSVGIEFVTLYDRDIDDEVQIKEVLSLGVSVVII